MKLHETLVHSSINATISALDAEKSELDVETSAFGAATSAIARRSFDAMISALDAETAAQDAETSVIARSFRRYRRGVSGNIGDCGVGITPQMCNRVTNHGDMSTFSKPAFNNALRCSVSHATIGIAVSATALPPITSGIVTTPQKSEITLQKSTMMPQGLSISPRK